MKDVPKQADELTADEACKGFKVTLSQLADATLHARHLTLKQSSELGVNRGRVKLYKAGARSRCSPICVGLLAHLLTICRRQT